MMINYNIHLIFYAIHKMHFLSFRVHSFMTSYASFFFFFPFILQSNSRGCHIPPFTFHEWLVYIISMNMLIKKTMILLYIISSLTYFYYFGLTWRAILCNQNSTLNWIGSKFLVQNWEIQEEFAQRDTIERRMKRLH